MVAHFPKQIGASHLRVDALAKVRGEHAFPSDIKEDETLFVRIARSDRAHAEIVAVDLSEAKKVPGIVGIFTADDIPGAKTYGVLAQDQPFLCFDRTRYDGEAIAVVAAVSDDAAREGAARVKVSYHDLPRVDFPPQQGGPLVHQSPVCVQMAMGFGDIVSEAREAALRASISYQTPRQEHAFLETEAGSAWYDENGILTLSVGGQSPHHDVAALSSALAIPHDKIRVLNPMMGGAFGGKEDLNVQLPLALATFKTGRPTRIMYDRDESIRVGVKRHSYQVSYEVGAASDGTLLTADISMLSDAGAYVAYTPVVLSQSVEHCTGPYRFKALKLDANAVYSNNGVASAFRGVGAPQVLVGIEQAMDEIACLSGLSPFEVRRKNLLKAGDKAGPGFAIVSDTVLEPLLDAAEAGALWRGREAFKAAAPFVARGVGVSAIWYSYGLGSGAEAGATVRLTRQAGGRFLLELGTPDVGNGNLTSFLQIAGEHLGCAAEDIGYIVGDSFGPNSGATHGSRTTYVVGNAVAKAAKELRGKIDAADNDGEIVVETSFIPEQVPPFVFGMPHIAYNYMVQVMGLEIDLLTGEVSVIEVENYVETGRMIHPQNVEGQIEGAFAQGLGFALYEDLVLDAGKVKNASLTNYVIPSIRDIPLKMTTRLFEHPDTTNPLGVRGLGELGLPVVPCSVANAVYDAIGHRFRKFPISPEAIMLALKGQE